MLLWKNNSTLPLSLSLVLSACQSIQTPTAPSDPALSHTDTSRETIPDWETDSPTVLAPEVKTDDMVFMLQRDNTYKLMSCSGTGDFNKLNRHPIIKNLNKYKPLKDAYQAAPVKYNESKNKLDWMFVSRNTVDVLTYQSDLVTGIENPSNHSPRVAELLIY